MTRLSRWKTILPVSVFCASVVVLSQAQTLTTLIGYDGTNGAYPQAPLVQGLNGNLYGTTQYGGTNGICITGTLLACGTVFEMTASGQLTTLYNFCAENNCADGDEPVTGLSQVTNGDFYGTTGGGGANETGGTVFQIGSAGRFRTLYSFCSQPSCVDGEGPEGSLVQATNGNFYGTTYTGGTGTGCGSFGCGTVFELTPAGKLTTLYSFCSQPECQDGRQPIAGLLESANGNFYGTTTMGGTNSNSSLCPLGCGTVFEITPAGKLTTLHNFCSKANCADGAEPWGVLAQADDGNFYGTTAWGNGFGTVYAMTPEGRLNTLYSFCSQPNCTDGALPITGLVQGSDGNLYGNTLSGGLETNSLCPYVVLGCGTIFEITSSAKLTTLYSFCSQTNCIDGNFPSASLVQATNGSFYGTTYYGGSSDYGTTFSLNLGLAPFATFVRASGKVGQTGPILGQGFTGTTSVSLNGTPANFIVVSDTFIKATVPSGATTGYVTVTTPTGVLTSNVPFHVLR